jgi:hypothetical protein
MRRTQCRSYVRKEAYRSLNSVHGKTQKEGKKEGFLPQFERTILLFVVCFPLTLETVLLGDETPASSSRTPSLWQIEAHLRNKGERKLWFSWRGNGDGKAVL